MARFPEELISASSNRPLPRDKPYHIVKLYIRNWNILIATKHPMQSKSTPLILGHPQLQALRLYEHLLYLPSPIYGRYLCTKQNKTLNGNIKGILTTVKQEKTSHPSYCMVTVLPMSANLRSSNIKKLCLSAIFRR